MWCIPELNDEFKKKMEDVLRVYKKQYDPKRPLICLDEKQMQLVGDLRKPIPAKPGKIAKQDYEYERKGTCSIFVAVEPKAGKRYVKVRKRRTRKDFAKVVENIISKYPRAQKIDIVLDNLNTHNAKSFYETFDKEKAKKILSKIQFHNTPKHGSWLNIAEIEISALTRQCLSQRIPTIETLKHKVKKWQDGRNKLKIKINWSFSKKDAKNVFPELYKGGN